MAAERPATFASADGEATAILRSSAKAMADTDWLAIEEVLYHLQPGDVIAWPNRATPCVVERRSESNEVLRASGETLVYWVIEGRGGGQYRLTNWLHWGNNKSDDYDSQNPKGVYPQIRRIGTDRSDGELEAHLGAEQPLTLLARGPWYTSGQWADAAHEPTDADTVVFEKPLYDRPRFADVVGYNEMFDQYLVEPRETLTWPERRERSGRREAVSQLYEEGAVQAVEPAEITAYRCGGDE